MNTELNYVISKFLEYHNIIGINIGNLFEKGLSLLVLKYSFSFDIDRIRDSMINMQKTNISCSRYSHIEC